MEPFKNLINIKTAKKISTYLEKDFKNFKPASFIKEIESIINSLELKDRVRLISNQMYNHLIQIPSPVDYKKILKTFNKIITDSKGFELWPISQFIEDYGINYKNEISNSLNVLGNLTINFTAEFAMRNYINHFEEESYKQLFRWAKSENEHHRRLASESTRPNLPWGNKIEKIKELIQKNLEILEILKFDESEYVRKSVSNHMNDLSRINKKLYLETITNWKKQKVNDRLIRHSLRTLLKAADEKALNILGYNKKANFNAKIKNLTPKQISLNDKISISYSLKNNEAKKIFVLIDIVIYFPMKNGKTSKKVFRIKDTTLAPKATLEFEKIYHFKKVTTRKHYPGEHILKLQVNGNEFDQKKFILS